MWETQQGDGLKAYSKRKAANSGAKKTKDKKMGEGGREQSMKYIWAKSSLELSVKRGQPQICERLTEIARSVGYMRRES